MNTQLGYDRSPSLKPYPLFFLWKGLTVPDVSSSSVWELGAGGTRFNDVVLECISERLGVLRVELVTRCGLGTSGKSQIGLISLMLIFQGDVLSLTRASVVVGSGASFLIHFDLRENGFSPLNTENLLSSVTGAVPVLFPVLPLPLTLT